MEELGKWKSGGEESEDQGKWLLTVVDKTVTPKESTSYSPEYVPLHGNRNFIGVIKLGILRWEIILDYPDGPNIITAALIRERQEDQNEEKEIWRQTRGYSDVFWGWRSQEPRSWPLKTEKGKEMDFSPEASRRNTLILDFWL